jgi:hypothetical protein
MSPRLFMSRRLRRPRRKFNQPDPSLFVDLQDETPEAAAVAVAVDVAAEAASKQWRRHSLQRR